MVDKKGYGVASNPPACHSTIKKTPEKVFFDNEVGSEGLEGRVGANLE